MDFFKRFNIASRFEAMVMSPEGRRRLHNILKKFLIMALASLAVLVISFFFLMTAFGQWAHVQDGLFDYIFMEESNDPPSMFTEHWAYDGDTTIALRSVGGDPPMPSMLNALPQTARESHKYHGGGAHQVGDGDENPLPSADVSSPAMLQSFPGLPILNGTQPVAEEFDPHTGQIFVVGIHGRTHGVQVTASTSVREVARHLQKVTGIPAGFMRVSHNGHELTPSTTMESAGVSSSSILRCTSILLGGAPKARRASAHATDVDDECSPPAIHIASAEPSGSGGYGKLVSAAHTVTIGADVPSASADDPGDDLVWLQDAVVDTDDDAKPSAEVKRSLERDLADAEAQGIRCVRTNAKSFT